MPAVFSTYGRSDLAFERGEGAYLYTREGERYLDFAGGIAVTALGHAHPHLVAALTGQAGKVWHVSNVYRIPGQERLAERLTQASFADKAFFGNSGAEAVECTIKVVRRYQYAAGHPERFRLVTFEGAFHGRTLATVAAGGQGKHLEGFGPPVEGFDHVAPGDIDAVRAAITHETAGILIEPILGEGGIRPLAPRFLRQVRELCDDRGLLLAFDEVQCGIGRTGKLFAHEWSGVTPDVMAVAKGLGGGFPVGACLATDAAAKPMTPGTHGSTFGGNPLAMAVANAVLDVVLEPEFLDHVGRMGLALKQKLAGVVDAHPGIFELVRGEGLMLGLKCVAPNTGVVEAFRNAGLLAVGAADNVVRLLPPLIIGEAEIDDALSRIERACEALRPAAGAPQSGARG